MGRALYQLSTGASVALSAATAKSVLCAIAPAQFGIDLESLSVSFDGSAAAAGVLVELCTSTLATNSTPGTNNTTGTVNQVAGRSITNGFTGFYNSTSEPTVLTVIYSELVTPFGGTFVREFPWGSTPDTAVSAGMVLRLTAPASVNCRASMRFGRC